MTEPSAGGASPPTPFDWEGEGLHVGESLDQFHCIVVLGEDVEATARVALGLSRAQSSRRRVALGDLLGEAPSLQSLVEGEEYPEGLVDSFLYGVSLNRIARLVPDAGELFILPTGSEPIDYEEILGDPRWRRLAAGFREVGALLVIAAPASAARIEQLVGASDGAVLVGEAVPPQLPVSQVIASLREPVPEPAPEPPAGEEEAAAPPRVPRWWQLIPLPVAGAAIAAAVLVVVVGLWLLLRALGSPQSRIAAVQPQRTTATAAGAAVPDSVARADSVRSAMAASAALPIANPADSAGASSYAVSWLKFNTRSGALLHLQNEGKGLPAATFTPVLVSTSPWYELRVGAYTDTADAQSLLTTLRGNELLPGDAGNVIRAPLAFVVDSASSGDDARRLYAEYAARQLPIYCLQRSPGSRIHLYVGAFSSPVESSLYAGMLRVEGISPVLVYRIGRVYKCA